jgi:hypothetical protein
LKAGKSIILYFTDRELPGLGKYRYLRPAGTTDLDRPWKLKALKGGPELFRDTILPELSYWTDLNAESYRHFSGTCQYSTSFRMEDLSAAGYLLRFEAVEASARVYVNDREVATLWSFPFEVRVDAYLKKGENRLRVEVSNLGANRIRYLDRKGIEWKKFHNINMVDLDYESLDATGWDVLPSGLGGKVQLIELAHKNPEAGED